MVDQCWKLETTHSIEEIIPTAPISHCLLQMSPGVFWSHDHSALTSPVLLVQTVNSTGKSCEPFQLATWIMNRCDQLDTWPMRYEHYWPYSVLTLSNDVTTGYVITKHHQTFFNDLETLEFLPEANLAFWKSQPLTPTFRWCHVLHTVPRVPCAPYGRTQARHARWEGPVQREEPAVGIGSTMQKRPHFFEDWLVDWLKVCCVCFRSFHVSRLQAPSIS